MVNTKIVLLGYMGSGKTAVGEHLATVLNQSFIDLDHYIEINQQQSISAIFQSKGELYFRNLERKALEELMQLDEHQILSLGGGTPCYYDNMDFLNAQKKTVTVYLQTGIEELSNRLFESNNLRPLIAHLTDIEQLQEFIGKHLFERSPFYSSAKIIIKTDGKSVEEVTSELIEKLT